VHFETLYGFLTATHGTELQHPPLALNTTAHTSPSLTVHSTDWRDGEMDEKGPKGYMSECGLLDVAEGGRLFVPSMTKQRGMRHHKHFSHP